MKTGYFVPCFKRYSPADVRHIRISLGETVEEFAQRFFVSESAVKSWEAPEGSGKHREVIGAVARCMYWAEDEANNKASSFNNLIRNSIGGRS